jgi:hypothetical protein
MAKLDLDPTSMVTISMHVHMPKTFGIRMQITTMLFNLISWVCPYEITVTIISASSDA